MKRHRQGYGLKRWVLAVLVGGLAALWTWTTPGDATGRPAPGGAVVELFVLDNGFHTDLAVPRAALEARGGPLAEAVRALEPGDWILIGWGDAKFYVDQSPISDRLPDGARAFFARGNPSVVMLDPEQDDPRLRFAEDGRNAVRLSPAGFERMAARIEASLDLSGGGPRIAAARAGDDARFFASNEHFWIGHLCNHWTAQVLAAAGVPVGPMRSITSGEIMRATDSADGDALQADGDPAR